MAWITDSLSTALAAVGRLNPFGRASSPVMGAFSHQLALAAYMSSGMMRKVITIPAADRTQKWRDWQADKDAIALIEAEEKRLGLRAKVKQAEVLRGVGGGALLLITAGDHASPLDPATIAKGGLVAINVLSRWQITGQDWVTDLASPDYGCPRMFEISGDGRTQRIHPSRVICFRGDPVPMGAAVGHDDAFWGDCRLLRVFTEVQRSDNAQAWYADLVRKAKLLRFGVSGLVDYDQEDLNKRVALIAAGEDSLKATIYNLPSKDGAGGTVGGEQIDDYQVNWSGIPAMMDAFDQRVAAVSDIPFTRLMGRSPAGMNATGKSDQDNYWTMVSDGQENETRPCLEALDPLLLGSAGVNADDVTWRWAPLWTPTEQEEATAFKTFMEAFEKLQASATIPDRPFAEAMQNWMEEREYMPGLGAALSKLSEEERFGLAPDDDGSDPSAITQSGSGVEGGDRTSRQAPGDPMEAEARRRAANDGFFTDATPRPLYVQRKLLNAADLIAWAKSNGFTSTLPADDMHVTVLYSRTPVDPMKMGEGWSGDDKGRVTVKPGGPRAVERLGETAVVLLFASWDIEGRHRSMIEAGGSHDFPEYQPHVTLSYEVPAGFDLAALKPYTGALMFGPELFEPLDLDWKAKVVEE